MAIDPNRSLDIRTRAAEVAAELNERSASAPVEKDNIRQDQVEISAEARVLAEENRTDSIPVAQARLAEISDRLDSGFYDRPDVVEDVAKRILDSGDL